MPHDRYGRLVEAGDLVVGRGYNIKHDIVATVVGVTASESCNVTLVTVEPVEVPIEFIKGCGAYEVKLNYACASHGADPATYYVLKTQVEYGAAKDFEVLRKADGSVPADGDYVTEHIRKSASGTAAAQYPHSDGGTTPDYSTVIAG